MTLFYPETSQMFCNMATFNTKAAVTAWGTAAFFVSSLSWQSSHDLDFRKNGACLCLRPRDLNVILAHYLSQPIGFHDALRE